MPAEIPVAASERRALLAWGPMTRRMIKPLHCVVVLDLDRDSEETPIGRKFVVTSANNAVDGTRHERHCRVAGIDRPEGIPRTLRRECHLPLGHPRSDGARSHGPRLSA